MDNILCKACLIFGVIQLFSGCTDDDVTPVYSIASYDARFMDYSGPFGVGDEPIVTLEFDVRGRVTKRIGGFIYHAGAMGVVLIPEIFDSVSHASEKITITQKENLDDVTSLEYPYEKHVFLRNGEIDFVTYGPKEVNPSTTRYDTTFFFYTKGMLSKTVKRFWTDYESELLFDEEQVKIFEYEGNNLVTITGRSERWDGVIYTTVEKFEGYDKALNPIRSLFLFDETFYRSLSKNNYTKYSYEKRNPDSSVTRLSREWVLNYDEEGVPTFRY